MGTLALNSGFLSVIIAGVTPIAVLGLILFGIGFQLVAWQPPVVWRGQFGAVDANGGAVTAVAADSSGVFAAGSSNTLLLNRYDSSGQQLWSQHFVNLPYDQITSMSPGSDGIYIAGVLNGTNSIRKYDSTGTIVWTHTYRGGPVLPIMSSGVGHVFVESYYNSSLPDLLQVYDPSGNTLWTKSLRNNINYVSLDAYSDSSQVYVVGTQDFGNSRYDGFLQSYSFSGDLNWAKNLTCSCLPSGVSADSTGIYVAGVSYRGGLLIKSDFSGNTLWTKSFSAPSSLPIYSLQFSMGPSGIYLVLNDAFHEFLARYDTNGDQVWYITVRGRINSISAAQDGVYVGGQDSSQAALLAKYGQSSSLIFFGVNPPFSFGLVGLVGAIVVLSIFLFRRQRKKHSQRPKRITPHVASRPSPDESRWTGKPA